MPGKRVLLMYITEHSGHHRASLALEAGLRRLAPDTEIVNIEFLRYINPVLEKLINQTYHGIIKTTPEVWEYVYDNPKVARTTSRLRHLIHRYNSRKLGTLVEDFRPDVVACTQAFPCGVMADYKRRFRHDLPLAGVVTDYFPHLYWLAPEIDYYLVPAAETGDRLIEHGVPAEKIRVFGMPIDPRFASGNGRRQVCEKLELDEAVPTVLVMGGSRGLGPIPEIVEKLDGIRTDCQMVVVTGGNRRLKERLEKASAGLSKKIRILGYADNMDELMEAASLIVTKPGGLTSSEALSKGLPIVIVEALPGQEERNARFLLEKGVAVKVENGDGLKSLLEELFSRPGELEKMRQAARAMARSGAALDAARFLLSL